MKIYISSNSTQYPTNIYDRIPDEKLCNICTAILTWIFLENVSGNNSTLISYMDLPMRNPLITDAEKHALPWNGSFEAHKICMNNLPQIGISTFKIKITFCPHSNVDYVGVCQKSILARYSTPNFENQN